MAMVTVTVQDQTRVWKEIYHLTWDEEGLCINTWHVSLNGEQVTRHTLLRRIEELAPEDNGTIYDLNHAEAAELHSAIRDAVVNRYEEDEIFLVPIASPNGACLIRSPIATKLYGRPNLLKRSGLDRFKFVDSEVLKEAILRAEEQNREFTADMVAGLDLGRNSFFESTIGWFKARFPRKTPIAGDFNNGLIIVGSQQPTCTPEDAQKAYRLMKRPGVDFVAPVKVVYLSMDSTELNGPLGLVLNEFAVADALGFLPGNFQATVDKQGMGKGCVYLPHSSKQLTLERAALAIAPDAALLINIDELKKYMGADAPVHGTTDVLDIGQITFMGSQDYNPPTRANITISTLAKVTGDDDFLLASLVAGKKVVSKGFQALMAGDVQTCVQMGVLPRFGIFKACADLGLPGVPARLQKSMFEAAEKWFLKLINGVALPAHRRYIGASSDLQMDEMLVPASLWKDYKPVEDADGNLIYSVVAVLSHPMQGNRTYAKLRVVGCTPAEVFVLHPVVTARLRRDNDGDMVSVFLPKYLPLEYTHYPSEDVEVVSKKKDKTMASEWSIRAVMKICLAEQALIGWASDLATNAQFDAVSQGLLPKWEQLLAKPSSNFLQGTLDTVKHIVLDEWTLPKFIELLTTIRKDHGFGSPDKEGFCAFFQTVKVRRSATLLEDVLSTLGDGSTAEAVAAWDKYLKPMVDAYVAGKHTIPMLKASVVKDVLSELYYIVSDALTPVLGEAGLEDELNRLTLKAQGLWNFHKAEVRKQIDLGDNADWEAYRKGLAKQVRLLTGQLVTKEAKLLFVMKSIGLKSVQQEDELAVTYVATLCQEFGISKFFRAAVQGVFKLDDVTGTVALTTDRRTVIRTSIYKVGLSHVRSYYHQLDVAMPDFLVCDVVPWEGNVTAFKRKATDSTHVLAHAGIAVALPYRDFADLVARSTDRTFTLDVKSGTALLD